MGSTALSIIAVWVAPKVVLKRRSDHKRLGRCARSDGQFPPEQCRCVEHLAAAADCQVARHWHCVTSVDKDPIAIGPIALPQHVGNVKVSSRDVAKVPQSRVQHSHIVGQPEPLVRRLLAQSPSQRSRLNRVPKHALP